MPTEVQLHVICLITADNFCRSLPPVLPNRNCKNDLLHRDKTTTEYRLLGFYKHRLLFFGIYTPSACALLSCSLFPLNFLSRITYVVFPPQPSTRSACELLPFFPLMSYCACGCSTVRFWLATVFKVHCGDMRILKLCMFYNPSNPQKLTDYDMHCLL
jgi:hypothetical protein